MKGGIGVAVLPFLIGGTFAQQFPFTFVRANPILNGYRETHASACTRVGMLPTEVKVFLSSSELNSVVWDSQTLVLAAASVNASGSLNQQSCCSPTMFCDVATSSCWTTGFGGMYYENTGWTTRNDWVPVYTCMSSAVRPDVPVLGRAFRRGFRGSTAVLDGLNLGVVTRDLRATIDGQPCNNVEVCSNICRPCVDSGACGDDKLCVVTDRFRPGNCLRQCNPDFTCPCGSVCQVFSDSNNPSRIFRFCVDPRQLMFGSYCGDATPWTPPAGSNLTDRVECTAPSGVYGQGLGSRSQASGSSRSVRALRALPMTSGSSDDIPGAVLHLQLLPSMGEGTTSSMSAAAAHEEAAGPRALLEMQPGWQQTNTSNSMYISPLSGGYRYSSISAGGGGLYTVANVTRQGAFPVVITKRGWASTGLGPAAAAALGIHVTLPVLSDPSLVAFAPLFSSTASAAPPYLQPLPAWNTTEVVCTAGVNSSCPVIDVCTVPTCSAAGACVYLPTGGCSTSSSPYSDGEYPTHSTYIPLPAAVAGALPMIPTPVGDNPSRLNAGLMSDPAQRTPSTNPGAINWHPGSVWWNPKAGMGDIALQRPFAGQSVAYSMLDISYEDDGPMDTVGLVVSPAVASATTVTPTTPVLWRFPFFGSDGLSQLTISPNGYVRVVPNNPCRGQFQRGSCTLDTDYAGVVSPLMADFAPQQSSTAAYYAGQFDLMPLAIAALNATAGGPGRVSFNNTSSSPPLLSMAFAEFESARSAAPSRSSFCLTALELGLYQPPPSRVVSIANPSYSTHTCLSSDGSIQWRYGQILGLPGIPPSGWNVNTTVNSSQGGPPGANAWFAGVRSLSTVWDFMELRQGASGARNSTVGISQEVGLLSVPGTRFDREVMGAADFTARTSQQIVANAPGVQPGGTAALCALNTVACASPACGPVGTAVAIRWSGLGCGLGLEPLLPSILSLASTPSIRAAGQVPPSPYAPRLQCVFGTQTSPATWVPPSSIPGGTSGSNVSGAPRGVLSCTAPVMAPNASIGDTVTVRVQAVLPATPAAWSQYMSSLAWARPEDPNTWSTLYAELGIGPREGVFSSGTGMLTIELPVHGMTAVQGTVMATPLLYRYTSGSTCGCNALAPDAVNLACDSCGACGGEGRQLDCAGTCFGKAVIDDCGVCSAGTTQKLPNANKDCDGVCFGPRNDCDAFPTSLPNPGSATDGLTHVILYFFIVGTPLVFCTMGLTWASYWWCLSASDRERREQLAINALSRDPEALGIRAGLSDAQILRIPVKAWSSSASEFASVPGRTETGTTACPVCMEDLREGESVRMLPGCSHTGHVACFDTWLMRSTTCPVCRAELRTPVEVTQEEEYRRDRATAMTRLQQRQAARRMRMLDAARTDRAAAEPAQIELEAIQRGGASSSSTSNLSRAGFPSSSSVVHPVSGASGQRPWTGEPRNGARTTFQPSVASGAAVMPLPMMGVPEGLRAASGEQGHNWSPNPYGLLAQAAVAESEPGMGSAATYNGLHTAATPPSVPGSIDGEEMNRQA